jgi:acyl-CoA-binding protein
MGRREVDPDFYCPQAALIDEATILRTERRLARYRARVVAQRKEEDITTMALLTTQNQYQRRMWMVVTGGLVLTAVAALRLLLWQRRRGSRDVPNDLVVNDDDEPDDELCLVFNEAAKLVRSWQHDNDVHNVKLDQRDRLMLYGLYKQAMVGNRNESDAAKPSKLNIVEYAKFDAWGKFHGLPRSYAMEKYCEVVFHFSNGGTSSFVVDDNGESEHGVDDDVVYDDDDNEDPNEGEDLDEDGCVLNNKGGEDDSVTCMGLRPSTLSGNIHEELASSITPEVRLRNAAMSNDIVALNTIVNAELCDINNADEDGQTALHFAVDRKSHDCITALIKAGANVNAVDRDGIGVLQTSLCAGLDIEYTKLLLDAGANPDACDDDGDSPRTWVLEEGSLAIVELFERYETTP